MQQGKALVFFDSFFSSIAHFSLPHCLSCLQLQFWPTMELPFRPSRPSGPTRHS